jgi:hypothetical protein
LVADSAAATGLKYVADTTNYAVAAKGDLLVGTAADTLAPLTVGTNGHTLVADSAEATGLKWAAPTSGTSPFVGATAYRTANQSFTGGVATAVLLTDESYDTDAFHSTSTNTSRFTIPTGKDGKYSVTYNLRFEAVGSFSIVYLYKNGSAFQTNTGVHEGQMWNTGGLAQCAGSIQLDLVATDYIEIFAAIQTTYNLIKARVSIQYLGA